MIPRALRDALARRLLDGELSPSLTRFVHERVGRSESWRAEYSALRAAQRAAADDVPLARGQRDALEGLLFSSGGAVAEASPPSRAPRALLVGAAAAALALALVVVLPSSSNQAPAPMAGADEWQSRGADALRVGVRVRCLSDGAEPKVLSETLLGAGLPGAPVACPADGLLAFSVTNLAERDHGVFVLGVRDDGELLWYAPFERAGAGIHVEAGVVDRPLSVAASLDELDHGAGATLFAVFARSAPDGPALERELRAAAARGLALGSLDRLPVESVAQARAALRIDGDPQR
jgi:hypothetical protein